jgi:hypothetical protein
MRHHPAQMLMNAMTLTFIGMMAFAMEKFPQMDVNLVLVMNVMMAGKLNVMMQSVHGG